MANLKQKSFSENLQRAYDTEAAKSTTTEQDKLDKRFEKAAAAEGEARKPRNPREPKLRPVKKEIKPQPRAIRDNISLLEEDLTLLQEIDRRLMSLGIKMTKSGIFRGGLQELANLNDERLKKRFDSLEMPKRGKASHKN